MLKTGSKVMKSLTDKLKKYKSKMEICYLKNRFIEYGNWTEWQSAKA
jgi:hypothetical protein